MLDRQIAGITCLTVLGGLETYLAGELDATDTLRVEAHLAECDRCTRFGGVYAEVCKDLRGLLGEPEPVASPILNRLRERLEDDLSAAGG